MISDVSIFRPVHRERSESSEETTSIILHNVLRTMPLNIAAEFPSTDALEQCIRRQRAQVDLDSDSQLPLIVKRTDRGEDFVLPEDESMIIFTSKSNLRVLKQCQHWFYDEGTNGFWDEMNGTKRVWDRMNGMK